MKKNVVRLLRNFFTHEIDTVSLLVYLFGTIVPRALLTNLLTLDVTQMQPTARFFNFEGILQHH